MPLPPKEEARFAFGNAYPEGGSKVRFYCLYERSEVISREGEFTNGRITVSLRAAGAAIPLNEVRHMERKRNIPPNHRPTRCHCEARSAAAIPLKKNGKYAP